MRYRLLGDSGLRVSEICLGTMTFGEDWGWGAAKDEARKMYEAYREADGNFIDTANLYTLGSSEKFVGEFVRGHRGEVVLATKYTNAQPGKDPNAAGNHRKSMFQAIGGSLKRLGTDYIDLYWLHIWDQITPVEEVMRGFEDLIRSGKVLYAGVSDAPAWWIARANTLAEYRGWGKFVGLQIEYSLIERTVERELLPMAKALGLGITAWSPLAGGVLSGKYQSGAQVKDGRFSSEMMKPRKRGGERAEQIVAAVTQVAQQLGRSAPQVALAWLLHRDQPIIPIIGTRKIAQLHDNLAALELKLDREQLRLLDEVSAVPLGFPHEFYREELIRGIVYGGLRDKIIA
ncbi:MAG: aldo/keto reductase [Tepidisphaeraceae bacterium]|jgi:aryl-alcohol dehydrogenase-like predicted oxidoreductase